MLAKYLIYSEINRLINSGSQCVLATVTGSYGSSPQKSGSSAIWNGERLIFGTIGGGTVENSVSNQIPKAMETGESGYFWFDLNNSVRDDSGPVCGGGMNVLLDATPYFSSGVFSEIVKSGEKRETRILISGFTEGRPVKRQWVTKSSLQQSDNWPVAILHEAEEPAIICIGAAVENAIFDACGARLFRMPFTPDRVKAALEKQL